MEKNSENKSILSALFSVQFSDEEQPRITAYLSSREQVSKRIRDLMPKTKGYEVVKSKLKIPGGRPGQALYNQEATKRLLKDLATPNLPTNKIARAVYCDAVFLYIANTHPSLFKLINTVKVNSDFKSEDLFKFICSNATEFEVSQDSIRELYELVWVPRIQEFDSLMGMISSPDPKIIQNRKIEKLESTLGAMEKKLEELKLEVVSSIDSSKEEIKLEISAGLEKLSEVVGEISPDLTPQLEPSLAALKGSIGTLDSNLAKVSRSVEGIQSAVVDKANSRDMRAELKAISDGFQKATESIKADLKIHVETIMKTLESVRAENEKRGNAVLADLKKVESEIEVKIKAATSPSYQSPLKNKPNIQPSQFRLKTEVDLVCTWSSKLSQITEHPPANEELLALHSLLLTSRVVIASDLSTVQGWLDSMGWSPFVMNLVPSPNWTKEQDWAEGAHHLFSNSTNPRILMLHGYDSAIPECYLLPTLGLWRLQDKDDGLGKLILVPANSSAHPSADVLEHASYLPPRGKSAIESYGLLGEVKWPRPGGNLQTGVDPCTANNWKTGGKQINFDFGSVNRAIDTDIPDYIVKRFRTTASSFSRNFIEKDAVALALAHEVLPWVHAKLGEARCADFISFLEQLN